MKHRDAGACKFSGTAVDHENLPPHSATYLDFERPKSKCCTVAMKTDSLADTDGYAGERPQGTGVVRLTDSDLYPLERLGGLHIEIF